MWKSESKFTFPIAPHPSLRLLLGNFRFEYEYEIDYVYDFIIQVCRLYIITSHTNLYPAALCSTSNQQEGMRALETSLVENSKVVLVLVV